MNKLLLGAMILMLASPAHANSKTATLKMTEKNCAMATTVNANFARDFSKRFKISINDINVLAGQNQWGTSGYFKDKCFLNIDTPKGVKSCPMMALYKFPSGNIGGWGNSFECK